MRTEKLKEFSKYLSSQHFKEYRKNHPIQARMSDLVVVDT